MAACENCLHKTVCGKHRATGGHVKECENSMDNYMATEMAYKNGYEKGYEDGKKDAVVHAKWVWVDAWDGDDTFGEWKMLCCSNCLESEGARENAKFCSECGAIMDLE